MLRRASRHAAGPDARTADGRLDPWGAGARSPAGLPLLPATLHPVLEEAAHLPLPLMPGPTSGQDTGTEEDTLPVPATPPPPLPESGWSSSRAPSPRGSSPGVSWLARASWASSWVW